MIGEHYFDLLKLEAMSYRSSKSLAALGLTLAMFSVSCGQPGKPGGSGRQAGTQESSNTGEGAGPTTEELVEANFKEGSQLPEGWPVDVIPLPPGAAVVASLNKTALPGSTSPTSAVLYSTAQSPQEVHEFLANELPKRGWTVLETSPSGETMVTAARRDNFLGVFSSGKGLGSLEPEGREAIGMQVVLAEMLPDEGT